MEKSRSGRLALTDLEGGIGTLSNLGAHRVDHFRAIISPGQSFIRAVGGGRRADRGLHREPDLERRSPRRRRRCGRSVSRKAGGNH